MRHCFRQSRLPRHGSHRSGRKWFRPDGASRVNAEWGGQWEFVPLQPTLTSSAGRHVLPLPDLRQRGSCLSLPPTSCVDHLPRRSSHRSGAQRFSSCGGAHPLPHPGPPFSPLGVPPSPPFRWQRSRTRRVPPAHPPHDGDPPRRARRGLSPRSPRSAAGGLPHCGATAATATQAAAPSVVPSAYRRGRPRRPGAVPPTPSLSTAAADGARVCGQ